MNHLANPCGPNQPPTDFVYFGPDAVWAPTNTLTLIVGRDVQNGVVVHQGTIQRAPFVPDRSLYEQEKARYRKWRPLTRRPTFLRLVAWAAWQMSQLDDGERVRRLIRWTEPLWQWIATIPLARPRLVDRHIQVRDCRIVGGRFKCICPTANTYVTGLRVDNAP